MVGAELALGQDDQAARSVGRIARVYGNAHARGTSDDEYVGSRSLEWPGLTDRLPGSLYPSIGPQRAGHDGVMVAALVERAQRGDAEAFDSLARLVGDRCLAIAVRILRDVHLAEDAVQAALITA